nr:hypothetical protein [Kibdelosporangium sp. MJ126-NF4]CEL16357.1 hypothetical protein [Kibdelosporangium sp. MJ126-NF4]CTQ94281.1 hypothetical protein [Kibdelosporangium sp. MJ126-NF4]
MTSDKKETVAERKPSHALPDDADGPHPLVDLSRDPHPGVADHAKPDDED